MPRPVFRFVLAILLLSRFSHGEDASTLLEMPPAFEVLFGNPRVVQKGSRREVPAVSLVGVGRYLPFQGVVRDERSSKVIVRSAAPLERDDLRREMAGKMAGRFYDEMIDLRALSIWERRLEMQELVPISRDEFIALAVPKLLGSTGGSGWRDAWWRVRMGKSSPLDSNHHLLVTVLHFDHGEDKISTGHISLGLRAKGGDPQRDFILDFRAPWDLDRNPKYVEAFNPSNTLKLKGFTVNLYDWLHTQTEYRNCYVDMFFLPVTRDQRVLLRYFGDQIGEHEAGNFRALRKNCASLAQLFFDRIQPIDEPVVGERGIADIPMPAAARIVERYDDVRNFTLTNVTDERGREPTAKSEIHRAVPTRRSSRVFKTLAGEPTLNR